MSDPIQLIELKCRNCGSQLDPADISPVLAAARCRHCDALFAIPTVVAPNPHSRSEPTLRRKKARQPKNFTVAHEGDKLSITRRWFTLGLIPLLIFGILWNGFMIVWHTIALKEGQWIMSAFGSIHTAIGFGLAYAVAAGFLNSTVIQASTDGIAVRHGPLPWKGNKRVRRDQIEQLYCDRKISHGKNSSTTHYELIAITPGDQREVLIRKLESPEQAIFIEQQIEQHLGIKNLPVAGEISHF